jgi:phosphatidylserine/phosphatidylglycerophosphate/cardiolipin synthase-like enzyme
LRQAVLAAAVAVLVLPAAGRAEVINFVEPNDGRAPIVAALDGATQSIDLYVFRLRDEAIRSRLVAAQARGVSVRVLLEPCPGEGTACAPVAQEALDACLVLVQGRVAVKWANPAFPKTHAKSLVTDGTLALVTTINLTAETFDPPGSRDYGVRTDLPLVIADFAQAFAQDWQTDPPITDCSTQTPIDRPSDPTVLDYPTLVVSPDNARDRLIGTVELPGMIRSATLSLKIHMEKADAQTNRGIVPAITDAIRSGVQVQMLLRPPSAEPGNQAVADAINLAGGEARFQATPKLHAKMIIADGAEVFVGSHNLTRSSLDERREIGWILNDPATLQRFQQTFDADWASAPPPATVLRRPVSPVRETPGPAVPRR